MNITTESSSYFVGDVPSPLELELDFIPEPEADLHVTLIKPDISTEELDAVLDGETITVEFPETSVFETRGVYTLVVSVDGNTVSPWRFPVEDTRGWISLNEARLLQADFAQVPDLELFELLDSAHTAVVEFAPALSAEEAVPSHYRKGQLAQAKAIWDSSRSTNASEVGDGEFSVTVFPLDWHVKQLLRPKDPTGGIW